MGSGGSVSRSSLQRDMVEQWTQCCMGLSSRELQVLLTIDLRADEEEEEHAMAVAAAAAAAAAAGEDGAEPEDVSQVPRLAAVFTLLVQLHHQRQQLEAANERLGALAADVRALVDNPPCPCTGAIR
jgi:hypothetical protein